MSEDFILPSINDLFHDEKSNIEINLSEIDEFPNHPFKVIENEDMENLKDSIKEHGVITPATVRRKKDGRYELISGHRRKKASELAGLKTLKCEIVDISDEEAIVQMVDGNLQRTTILPSEKAFAYKMKLEALKHQGKKTLDQLGPKWSTQEIGKAGNDSMSQVKCFIRLTELIPTLLDMVDERKIAFNPAVELSYLKKEEQTLLLEAMDSEQATPSLSQAQRLKKFSQQKMLSLDVMRAVMSEEKKTDLDRVTLKNETLRKYFPKSYTPKQMEDTIIKLLEGWYKKRQLSQER